MIMNQPEHPDGWEYLFKEHTHKFWKNGEVFFEVSGHAAEDVMELKKLKSIDVTINYLLKEYKEHKESLRRDK